MNYLINCNFQIPFILIVTYNLHMTNYEVLKNLKKPYFSLKEAKTLGISSRVLSYLVKTEKIIRVSQGIYAFPGSLSIDNLDLINEALLAIPSAIVGFRTAIFLYDLSDDPAGNIHLIVPYEKTPKVNLQDVQLHRTRTPLRSIQTQTHRGFKVTTPEQTIVDLLKAGETMGQLLEIIARAQTKRIPIQIDKIQRIADKQRAKTKIRHLLDALAR